MVEKDGAKCQYSVVETKSSLFKDDLHGEDGVKVRCGEYRTRQVIPWIYDAMQRAMKTGEPYQTAAGSAVL